MSMHLTSGRINIGLIKELARKELLDYLNKRIGTKAIIWDDKLIGRFGLIAEYSLLKQHGVVQMFQLRPGKLGQIKADHVIYILRPKLQLMKSIASNVLEEKKDDPKKFSGLYHILFTPRNSLTCERKLEDLGIWDIFNTINEFGVFLYPIDSDVVSLELEYCFKEVTLENDSTTLYYAAKSLMTIQNIYGVIHNVYGQGKAAKHVFDVMTRLRRELGGKEPQVTPQIDCLLLFDRGVDVLSPLITQFTYEGLLDELFGINNNNIKLPGERFSNEAQNANEGLSNTESLGNETKQFVLNSSDELFAKLRDKCFTAVGPLLSKTAKGLTAQFEERHQVKTNSEMKQFVDRIPYLTTAKKSLANHIIISELIKELTDKKTFHDLVQIEAEFLKQIDTDKVNAEIEEMIAKHEPLVKVLRLICIQSIVNSGLKQRVLDYYKREILQTYGYQQMLTLNNLEKAGLLRVASSYMNRGYGALKRNLRLVVDDVNDQNPTDIAYIYRGFAPICARLAQFLIYPGWKSIADVLKTLPEPTVEETQNIPVGLKRRRNSESSIQSNIIEEPKVILVFFLGGCTYSEISALRFLSQQEELNVEFVVATTKLINGKTFMESIFEPQSSL